MQELQRQASLDPLTGLKNRRRFEEDLRVAMARSRRDGTTGAVLMLDLDHFKQVNDSHGHPAGDRMIEEIAGVLRQRTRESDMLARLGGDEFAIVLPRCSPAEARVVAESIAHGDPPSTARPTGGSTRSPPASASRCSATTRAPASSSVVSEADTAMYAAKDGGRDGVRVFDPIAVRDEAEPAELRALSAPQARGAGRAPAGPAASNSPRSRAPARSFAHQRPPGPFRRPRLGEEEQVGAGAGPPPRPPSPGRRRPAPRRCRAHR